jgi:hypothetical protein
MAKAMLESVMVLGVMMMAMTVMILPLPPRRWQHRYSYCTSRRNHYEPQSTGAFSSVREITGATGKVQ